MIRIRNSDYLASTSGRCGRGFYGNHLLGSGDRVELKVGDILEYHDTWEASNFYTKDIFK